jgi:hypothetical protein
MRRLSLRPDDAPQPAAATPPSLIQYAGTTILDRVSAWKPAACGGTGLAEPEIMPHAVSRDRVAGAILFIRGRRVLLDADLAGLYEVDTRTLNQAVRRNRDRFPPDFMFQLTAREAAALRSQIVISNARGGRRTRPYAFTEQGIAMLSSVLRSPRAIAVNVTIMRAFVRLRRLSESYADLARKLDALERKYDRQFHGVFEAIRTLMVPDLPARRRIGFRGGERSSSIGRLVSARVRQ